MKKLPISLSIVLPGQEEVRRIEVNKGVMAYNDERAAELRRLFELHGLFVMNVLSSPGSGKTEFLARTLDELPLRSGVVVGDLSTDNDARRLRGKAQDRPVVQIMTHGICHLEAEMVARALAPLPLDELDLLVIENVGNLVCPAGYDLGESYRVVLLSVTEGEDKPLKYPKMFKTANAVVINKIDLASAVGFDREAALDNIRKAIPKVPIFEVSAKTGAGMDRWYDHLARLLAKG